MAAGRASLARLAITVLLLVSLAGCTGDTLDPVASPPPATLTPRPTIVALIDSGINPYHVAFHSDGIHAPDASRLPVGATPVPLALLGTYEERRQKDRDFWTNAEAGRLYAFQGTRVLAISMRDDAPVKIQDEEFQHGTGTASMVAREDPHAIIVIIQVSGDICALEGRTDCFSAPEIARAMQWAADQPWIDIVSVSLGAPANLPAIERAYGEQKAFLDAARLAHARGKVVLNSAGNSGTPTLGYSRTGPPWVITVGGVEAAPRGDSVDSSKMMDVAANYTEWVADATSVDGMIWTEGTSFSSPIVAGVLSRALHDVRTQLGDNRLDGGAGLLASGTLPDGRRLEVGSRDLRDALNASALLFGPTEWDPTRPPSNQSGPRILNNIPVLAPGPQMGWGYVDGSLAPAVTQWVLSLDRAMPSAKAAVALYQNEWQKAREAYWSTR